MTAIKILFPTMESGSLSVVRQQGNMGSKPLKVPSFVRSERIYRAASLRSSLRPTGRVEESLSSHAAAKSFSVRRELQWAVRSVPPVRMETRDRAARQLTHREPSSPETHQAKKMCVKSYFFSNWMDFFRLWRVDRKLPQKYKKVAPILWVTNDRDWLASNSINQEFPPS